MEIPAGPFLFRAIAAGPADGDLVLLLHGFPQTSSSWTDVVAALGAEGYRAVAPDQRGYSPGARPSGLRSYRPAELLGDVLAIADRLGAERFHLVGHDWGGVLAWLAAALHPERLRTLTVVSTPHPAAYARSLFTSLQPVRSLYAAFFQLPLVPEATLGAGGRAVLRAALVRSGLSPERADEHASALSEPGALNAAVNWYRAANPIEISRAGRITTPTLYVWGPGDVSLGRRAAEMTGRHVDGPYRFVVLDGATHWIPEERSDDLSRLLLEHLAGDRAPA